MKSPRNGTTFFGIPKKGGEDLVKGIGDIGKTSARAVAIKKGGKTQREHLIRPVPAEDVLFADALARGNGGAEPPRIGAGITAEIVPFDRCERPEDARRGRVRIFVGIEFCINLIAQLFARRIRQDRARLAAQKVHVALR